MMNCDIVVAHYKENVDEWIQKIHNTNIRHIYLYSKNTEYKISLPLIENKKLIHKYLPNIGRESHTYLTYCIENYDNLPDFTFFLQGFSASHGVTLGKLNKWIESIDKDDSITHTKNYTINSLMLGLPKGRRPSWGGKKTQPSQIPMPEWFNHYIKKPNVHTHNAKIYFGAVFGVDKKHILSRSLDEYNDLLSEFQSINPEACHFIERSWYYWFNL